MASWLAEFPLRPPYTSYQPLIFSSSFFFIFLLRMRHVAISLIISLFVINTKEAAAFSCGSPSTFSLFYCTVAISISDSSFARFSRLVASAAAVSNAVNTFTPVSMAFRRITNPSWLLSAPCCGISMTRSIS